MDIYSQLVEKIIQEQESIIGSVALEQAKKVEGISVNWEKHEISISGDKKDAIQQLVLQYQHLFGRASVEACRMAVKDLLPQVPKDQLPPLLQ